MGKFILLATIALFCYCFHCAYGNVLNAESRSPKRFNIPFLGMGAKCTGCPAHFCDDDPAIVRGYCCGCARFYDSLPVKCSAILECPLNTYDLCDNYEYMMNCCCS